MGNGHIREVVVATFMLLLTWTAGCRQSEYPLHGKLDASARPLLYLSLEAPSYLQTSVPAATTISITLISFDKRRIATLADANNRVAQEAVIEEYPSQKKVSGTWTGDLKFVPLAPLGTGEYVVRFPNAGSDLIVKPRPYNLFRVGSALRVTEISALRDKSSTTADLTRVEVAFSEAFPKASAVKVEVSQRQGTTWAPVAVTSVSQTASKLGAALDPQSSTRVTVTCAELDGAWTGVAGSGPVTAEFVPKEYEIEPGEVIYPVPPNLKIELPSGQKKP